MGEGAFSDRELDGYRAGADRFIAELDEEYYLHYAGLKPDFELRAIYERHADLTDLETIKRLGETVDGRTNLELFRFGCEGYLGELTREHAEKIAELETKLETQHDGETVGYRMLPPTIANTADRDSRARLEEARNDLTEEHLNPLYLEAAHLTQRAVPELGAPTYFNLYRDRFQYDLEGLASQCRTLLDSTERLYEESMDRVLRERVGVGLAEAERYDVRRFFRGSNWDEAFPADRMVPALRGTLSNLGIDLDAQDNVHLDVEERPTKSPRAFCAPIEIPGKVMLVIQPQGGPDDWYALFHEAGHTEHFAFTSPNLKMEEKRLGDNAVTEGWAMLFDHLIDDRAWLSNMLDFPRPETFAAEGAVQLLFYVRRYCAKLLYEIEFHAAPDPTQMQSRYVEILGDALKIVPSPTDYLSDIDYELLRHVVPPRLGLLGADDDVHARTVRQRLVPPPRGGITLERAVGARAAAECRRAAEGRDGRGGRDGSGRGARPLRHPDSGLERYACRRRRCGIGAFVPDNLAGEEVLDQHHVVARALDDGQQRSHRRDLLALLLQEPVQELLAHEVAFRPRELRQIGDLLGHALLLLEREPNRLDDVREVGLRRLDARDHDPLVGVEQVLDDHHRVVPLLDRLPVEVRGETRERLGVVVDGDRDVLLRRAELVPDLLVQAVREGSHAPDSNGIASPRAAAPRQRADAVVPARHGRADRGERPRLGALPAPRSARDRSTRSPTSRARSRAPARRSGTAGS